MASVHVTQRGGAGLALVLFHGWGFDSRVWLPVVSELKPYFTVYLADLPGFGQTPLMDWFEFKQSLLSQLPDSFAVLGWSMGGGYAIRLASEHPLQVKMLYTIGASPKFIKSSDWPGITAEAFDKFMYAFSSNPADALKDFIKTQTGRVVEVDKRRLPSEAALAVGLDFIKQCDLRAALKEVGQACFMFGRLDAIVPARTLTTMQQQFPQFEYVLFRKSAHMPFITDKDLFIKALHTNMPKM